MCKTLRIGMLALVVLGLTFVACDKLGVPNKPDNPGKTQVASNPYVTDIIAGQHYDAGDVYIYFTPDYIYLEFQTQDNWWLKKWDFHIATDVNGFPQKNGNPIPGQFDYHQYYANGTTHDVVAIPWGEWEGEDHLCFAFHCEVERRTGTPPYETQTGWGEGEPFPGHNWGMYFCTDVPKMLSLPTFRVQCRYTQVSGSTPSQFQIAGLPDPSPYNVENGYYHSFCLDRGIYIYPGWYSCRLWASYDPTMPDYCKYIRGTSIIVPYYKLNYLVDKFMDAGIFTGAEIAAYQTVFWFYRGIGTIPATGRARELYDEAELYAGSWVPGPGDWYGVLLDIAGNVQLCFILVDP